MRPHATRPTVVIVGAGFAGITLVRRLKRAPVRTILLDRHNYHLFTPLLYEVASALLDPGEIAQPVRAIIRRIGNAEFRLAQVESLDLPARQVVTDRGPIAYDYLVVAGGSVSNYFGNPALGRQTYGLKDLDEGLALRNRVLRQFEQARWTEDVQQRRALLTFAVIGGGPTGIEYAGALSELVHLVLKKDFRELDMADVRIVLIEAADHLLGTFPPKLRAAAQRSVGRKGIQVILGTLLEGIEGPTLRLSGARTLDAATVVWTAGVCANPLAAQLSSERGRGGTVRVQSTLQLPSHPEVLVIGDLAAVEQDGMQLPQLAPVAIQEGKMAAANIQALVRGRAPRPFHYRDKGIMATIGRNSGVVQSGPLQVAGFLGWVAWLFLHLILIVSLRSKLVVLINWTWDYLFYDRPVRLILEARRQPEDSPAASPPPPLT